MLSSQSAGPSPTSYSMDNMQSIAQKPFLNDLKNKIIVFCVIVVDQIGRQKRILKL